MSVTAYRVLRAPINQMESLMTEALAGGWQPLGSPFAQYPDSAVVYQALIKGTIDGGGGGGPVNITINDIQDAGATGKALMAAESGEAARSEIGAAAASDIPTIPDAPTWDTLDKPAVIAAGDNADAARQAIGAGTSNLELGSSADTAMPGNTAIPEIPGTATESADGLMSSADKQKLGGIAANATANDSDENLTDRANHTGTQPTSSIEGLDSTLSDYENRLTALESAAAG